MSWHLEQHTWEAYAAGRLDPAAEASVEAHVTGIHKMCSKPMSNH